MPDHAAADLRMSAAICADTVVILDLYGLDSPAAGDREFRRRTVRLMARVLVTGMSGAGKTTVLDELRSRGHMTVDTDYNGWELPDGTWDEPRMNRLLASNSHVVVSGTVENQGRFYDRFEHIVLVSAPLRVLVERVSRRTNNPYGKTPEEQAEIARHLDTVEPLLRRGATLELDGQRPASELADIIEDLLTRKL